MFGIGLPELGVILVIVLVIFGPAKLPELSKSVGKAIGEFKRATDDIKKDVTLASDGKQEDSK
jgi:TatA/E family protein of Tat protein translocase